ncbi:fructose-6-phosphate aldolase [bacterium]|nr:fructose-6-phosphate aldolase [candidate division CSSED10-310 bacterium]
MKIFLDTAHVEEIREAVTYGLVDGVTTNPSLVAKTGRKYVDVLKEICALVDGPISAEVISVESGKMVEEAKKLAEIHPNITIKIIMTEEGIKAASELVKLNIPVNMTLVFSPLQALLCGKIGVDFVSPFVGRLDDISNTGLNLVEDIMNIYGNYGFDTEVIVASVRHPIHVLEAAQIGAHISTLPHKVFKQMFQHPLTDIGVKKFLEDAAKIPKS